MDKQEDGSGARYTNHQVHAPKPLRTILQNAYSIVVQTTVQ